MRGILDEKVDFERLRAESPVRLLIAATQVKDGRLRIFREDEMTVEAVLASSCLPFLHHAIEIEGEAFILVQLIPEIHAEVPHLSGEISRRMQEIAFSYAERRFIQSRKRSTHPLCTAAK